MHLRILDLNAPDLVEFRRRLVAALTSLEALGQVAQVEAWLGFPEDLPDLRALRPPNGNSRPEGRWDSFHARRQQGMLPPTY